MEGKSGFDWYVTGCTVRGATHHRTGMRNQDSIDWRESPGGQGPIVLCVSDGHGSARYFRSAVGSELAVKTALDTLMEFLGHADGLVDEATRGMTIIERVFDERKTLQDIVSAWREEVRAHVEDQPFSDEELDRLTERDGEASRRKVENDPVLAYGATLLGVIVARDYVMLLQLGDGDILTVTEAGEVERVIVGDARLIANETTSLCEEDAWRNFRTRFQVLSDLPPALILAATDGYSNSFATDEDFLQVGSDLLALLKERGVAYVSDHLEGWLTAASESGSGDDISLGLISRVRASAGGTPVDGVAPSVEPEQDATAPEDDVAGPEDDVARLQKDVARPEDDAAGPEDDTVKRPVADGARGGENESTSE